jgi:nucleoside-triphosphatase
MKILLSGLPKSGKTTLLASLIEPVAPKHGLVAQEVVYDKRRIGFDLIDQQGSTAILARTERASDYPVGRFFVNLSSLETFIDNLFIFKPEDLLYVDEIGQMQLYSNKFKQLVNSYLDSSNDFIGTFSAIYEHPFIQIIKETPDALVCTVTNRNRVQLFTALEGAISNRQLFNDMPYAQRQIVLTIAREYLTKDKYISLRKLFLNALRYVVENRIRRAGDSFLVLGDHDKHLVRQKSSEVYECDCDLNNGRGQFKGNEGECSHIQAVKIVGWPR